MSALQNGCGAGAKLASGYENSSAHSKPTTFGQQPCEKNDSKEATSVPSVAAEISLTD